MITVADLLAAQLESELLVAEWLREFEEQFSAPAATMQAVQRVLGGDEIDGADRYMARAERAARRAQNHPANLPGYRSKP